MAHSISRRGGTPRVSVILTVYKRTTYLREAIVSVLRQSYREFELIVVDDSGTGAATSIVREFADGALRYLANETNRGIVHSIERAVSVAQGDYLAILNDDDVWAREAGEAFYAGDVGWVEERLYEPDLAIVEWRKLASRRNRGIQKPEHTI